MNKTMKKIFSLMAMVVMMTAMSVMTTACSDDDNGGDVSYVAGDVQGEYAGVMNMSVPAQPSIAIPPFDTTVKISAQDNGMAVISLPKATYVMNGRELVIPGFELENVPVVKSGYGAYVVGPAVINREVGGLECKGMLGGTISGGRFSLEYSMKVGKMPFDLVFEFAGEK